jgi:integrase/recombinase XerD
MKTAKASLFINISKVRENGTCPVSVMVYHNRVRRFYPTGIAMIPAEFNSITEKLKAGDRIKKTEKRLIELQIIIKPAIDQLTSANAIIEKLKIFTFGLFENSFLSNSAPVDSVEAGFNKYINELREEGRIGTAVTYECAKKSIESFKRGMQFGDITALELKRYERWMLNAGNSKATIGIYLRSLRSIFNQADVDKALYPFGKGRNRYTIPTGRNLKKALQLSEIAKIFQYQPAEDSTEEMARDYWVFMYLCNGMNLKDLCQLKRKNINGDLLTYDRAKTINSRKDSQAILVSLKPEAKAIISKWGQISLDPEAFVFPHLKRGTSPQSEREIIQQLNKTINKYMRRIATALQIDKPVTTYFARHSFATVLKRAGTSTDMISELLRHSSTQMTQNYLDGFEMDQIHEATNVLTAFNKVNQK